MRWASFDTFLTEDSFWQDKMGKPICNMEFLVALLHYGNFESYHFFCADSHHRRQFEQVIDQVLPRNDRKRVQASLQALFPSEIHKRPFDVMHQGDFTYHMPYLIEYRNRLAARPPFQVTGVTHSLDGVRMHTRFIQLLLAGPQPFDTIICSSKSAQKLLVKAFDHIRYVFATVYKAKLPDPPQLVHIPLALSEDLFIAQDKAACRQELGIPEHHFVMLSLARFSPRHKTDLAPFLECIEWLKRRQELPEFTLILAGAGKPADLQLVRDMLSHLGLQNNVRLESNVTFERKLLLYGVADAFFSLVDNYQETFGLTILEAMAQGLPVVASDFSGYKELVDHGRKGFLIHTYVSMSQEPWEDIMGLLDPAMLGFYQAQKIAFDMAELVRAIVTLASDPNLRQEMGERGRAAAKPYQWPRIIPRYEELWKKQRNKALQSEAQGGNAQESHPCLIPRTEEYFSHYPSALWNPDAKIALSDYGKGRSRAVFRPILYEDMGALLNGSCRKFLIRSLQQKNWATAELVEAARAELAIPRAAVILNFDWLVKHGYVSLLSDAT